MAGVILPLINVPAYSTISQFPASAAANQLATALDTGDLYVYFNGVWDLLATPSGSGGVTSLNALTGALSIGAGTNISVTPSGSTITVGLTGQVAIANGGTGQSTANAAFNALSPMTTAGDIIYGGTGGAGTRLSVGTSEQVLTVSPSTGLPEWQDKTDASWQSYWMDDFDAGGAVGSTGWAIGGGTISQIQGTIYPGVTGIAETSGSAYIYKFTGMYFGGGTTDLYARVQIPVLSNGGTTFEVVVGWANTSGLGSGFAAGAWFSYTDSVNSGGWVVNSAVGGTQTNVNSTSGPVAAATWYNLHININSNASLITYYVNGVSVGTISTNINTSNAFQVLLLQITNKTGSTSRSLYVDYVKFNMIFNASR